MPGRLARRIGLAVALASAGTLAWSLVELSQRLSDRNAWTPRFMARLDAGSFEYEGVPCLVETIDDGEGYQGEGSLRVTWRGSTHEFPIWMEPKRDAEGLARHDAWFGILMIADGADSQDALREKWDLGEDGVADVTPRLVVAARFPAEGWDKRSWGLVRKSEWLYDLVELSLDGPDETAMTVHRRTFEELEGLTGPSARKRFERLPTQEERDRDEAERRRDYWMNVAMQQVTPPTQYKGRTKAIDGVVISMGWPWKVAAVSAMALAGSLLFVAAARFDRGGPAPGL